MDDDKAIRIRAARAWLRDGYTTLDKVKALHRLVAASRGADYADRLREEMRQQWRSRAQWMDEAAAGPPA